jgi:hypothetical protein
MLLRILAIGGLVGDGQTPISRHTSYPLNHSNGVYMPLGCVTV